MLSGARRSSWWRTSPRWSGLAGAGKTLAAGRLAQTGAWVGDGSHRDVGSWMAAATGTTVGQARQTIETAERLGGLSATESVLRAGSLSGVQVDAITTAAAADASAESSLLAHASTDGVRGLRAACAAVEAAASTDQAARYEACRARRSLRHRRISDVEGLLEMRGPLDVTARVMAALQPHEAELFDQARSSGRREHPDALAFDALAQMADESAAVRGSRTAIGRRPRSSPTSTTRRSPAGGPNPVRPARSPASDRSRCSSCASSPPTRSSKR